MKRKLSILTAAATVLLVLFSSCVTNAGENNGSTNVDVTGVTLNVTSKTISVNETFNLTAYVTPDNATNKNVVWSTSDANIATVDTTGFVKGVAAGTATIKVTTEDGIKEAACTVTVMANEQKVKYTVSHSFEELDGTFVIDSTKTEKLEGKLGDKTTAKALTTGITGFTAKEITQETITATTTITVYYVRKTITLSFDSDGGSTVAAITGKYGAEVKAPANPTKANTQFAGWTPTLPTTFPAEDKTYKAEWTTTYYTVKHYTQPNDGSTIRSKYTITKEEKIYAKANTKTAAKAITIEGYKAPTVSQSYVKSDNSTVVSIYYDRKSYTITFDTDGGTTIAKKTFLYDQTIKGITEPTKKGYIFAGWSPAIPAQMPAKDLSVKALWTDKGSITVTVY